jgi:hypothetical protein
MNVKKRKKNSVRNRQSQRSSYDRINSSLAELAILAPEKKIPYSGLLHGKNEAAFCTTLCIFCLSFPLLFSPRILRFIMAGEVL